MNSNDSTDSTSFDSKLQKKGLNLLRRLVNLSIVFIEGRGVPFLGAGLSMEARTCESEIEPTVTYMIRQLVEHIVPNLEQGTINDIIRLLSACPPEKDQKNVDALVQAAGVQLGKLCSIVNQKTSFKHHKIVNILQIDKYAKLNPTPAHYFLAFLARETLINEVITTNYDCCLERAMSFSTFLKGSIKENQKRAVSIYSLNRYREVGARYLFPKNTSSILRIYKINGCADCLNGNAAHADSILLTERQLQDMDDRAWARDLLRDRARSRALVFSGFGSDEPQIQFTVLRLLEEFSNNGQPSTDPRNDIWINAHNDYLSYTQQQIMYEFWHNRAPEQEAAHLFTGEDENTFQALRTTPKNPTISNPNKLSANLFWETIFQIVFLALLRRYTRPGTEGWEIFRRTSFNETPYLQRDEFLRWIDPEQIGQALLDTTFSRPQNLNYINFNPKKPPLAMINKIAGYKQHICGMPEQNITPGIPLCLWLRCLDRIFGHMPEEKQKPPECYYTPLLCNVGEIIPLLLLYQNFEKENEASAESHIKNSPFITEPPPGIAPNVPPLLTLRVYQRKIHLISQPSKSEPLFSSYPENSRSMLIAFTQNQDFSQIATCHQGLTNKTFPTDFEPTTINLLKIYRVTQIPFFELIKTNQRIQQCKKRNDEDPDYMTFFVSLLSRLKSTLYHQNTKRVRLIKIDE